MKIKYPEIIGIGRFAELKTKMDNLEKKGIKNRLKLWLSSKKGRKLLFFIADRLEKLLPNQNHNFTYSILTSAYYWAGYLEGKQKFAR